MDELTPDEINALCDIPPDTYADLAMEVSQALGTMPLAQMDREVLKRWYAQQQDEESATS